MDAPMADVQNERDDRNTEIDKVGVKNLRYPIVVLDSRNEEQATVANVNMYVRLPREHRGTHMSRFLEILNEFRGRIYVGNIHEILARMKKILNSEEAFIELRFPYFIEKTAPVSGAPGLMEYTCWFHASLNEREDFILGVEAPVTTLCPCSKEISDGSAHNQRSLTRVQIRFREFVWIEEIVDIIERSASAPVYSLLKRADEKHLTELAYSQPRFAEDVVRTVAVELEGLDKVTWFTVEAENQESIHNHSAYAFIEKQK
jgi:GTP cyclohydrolase I